MFSKILRFFRCEKRDKEKEYQEEVGMVSWDYVFDFEQKVLDILIKKSIKQGLYFYEDKVMEVCFTKDAENKFMVENYVFNKELDIVFNLFHCCNKVTAARWELKEECLTEIEHYLGLGWKLGEFDE